MAGRRLNEVTEKKIEAKDLSLLYGSLSSKETAPVFRCSLQKVMSVTSLWAHAVLPYTPQHHTTTALDITRLAVKPPSTLPGNGTRDAGISSYALTETYLPYPVTEFS